MTRKPVLVGLRADSFVHVGVGQSFGEVDLPFVREPATDYPFIPGSALKGALRRAYWEEHPHRQEVTDPVTGEKRQDAVSGVRERVIFGDTDVAAGRLLVGDAKIVFLPVRSLGLGFRLLTCPTLLSRVLRDLARCGNSPADNIDVFDLAPRDDIGTAIVVGASTPLYLEDVRYITEEPHNSAASKVYTHILQALVEASDAEREDLLKRIVLVNDDAFAPFARHALPVRMRNRLNEDKLVVDGALWSEEYLPAESLLYMLLARGVAASGSLDPVTEIRDLFAARDDYLQVGGNETVGQGIIRFRMPAPASADQLQQAGEPSVDADAESAS